MKAASFEYSRPRSVAEACGLLTAGEELAKPIAGGQSLGPMLNLRLAQPAAVIDLGAIDGLREARDEGDAVFLGAQITHAAIEDARVPDPSRGLMPSVAANIAYRAVRNRGTVGGSLVHADPAADWPSTLTLLGATALIAGPGGRRELPVEKFLTGIFETALKQDELLVAVRIPKRSTSARYGYWKFCRKAGEFPQAIGGALQDPERRETRAVVGATDGAPKLFLSLTPDISGIGKDAYARQLHSVALRRAVARMGK